MRKILFGLVLLFLPQNYYLVLQVTSSVTVSAPTAVAIPSTNVIPPVAKNTKR